MRFLFIISAIPQNGVTICLKNLIVALRHRGHDVVLLLLTSAPEKSTVFSEAEVHVLNSRLEKVPNGYFKRRALAIALRKWVSSAPYRYDLVVSTMMSTDKIVHRADLDKVHYWLHIPPGEWLAGLSSRWKRYRRARTFRAVYASSDIIAVSKGLGSSLAEDGFHPRRTSVVYNGFDIDGIRCLGRQTSTLVPNERYILHVGRFVPAKRHDILFEAYKISGLSFRLLLLTEPTPELQALITRYDLSSRVLVMPFQRNPHPFYRNAEFTVLSSDREGLPNALVESLISGTPVVSTDCPFGPSEILRGELRRWLAPSGNAAALGELMRKLAGEPYKCDDDIIEPFSIEHMVSSFEAIAQPSATISDQTHGR